MVNFTGENPDLEFPNILEDLIGFIIVFPLSPFQLFYSTLEKFMSLVMVTMDNLAKGTPLSGMCCYFSMYACHMIIVQIQKADIV